METLKKATRLLLDSKGAMINGRYTTSCRDVIDQFQEGWELQVIRRQLSVDGSGTYVMLAIGFIEKGRQMLVGGMSLPEVLNILEAPMRVQLSNYGIEEVLEHICRKDILDVLVKHQGKHIVVDDKCDCAEDFIVEDNGYRVMYPPISGHESKDGVKVLVKEKVSDFSEIQDFYNGIIVTTSVEGEAKFTLEQMKVTLVIVDQEQLYDLHHLMKCDASGSGYGSCEVHFDYVTLQGLGDIPFIEKSDNDYIEAYRKIRRNGKKGCVFIYIGGKNSLDKTNRTREYRQGLYNLEHISEGTVLGNGRCFAYTKNPIHKNGIDNLTTERKGGIDTAHVIINSVKKAKSVAKEILSVKRIVN